MNPSVPQTVIAETFRDPAGSLMLGEDAAYRRIRSHARAETLAFLGDELVGALVAQGRLIGSEIVEPDSSDELCLRHPLIEPASYCWEWPPALWFAAADLTLNLCSELLPRGWTMKDATPHNVLFRGTEPVFVDVLSFERRDAGESVWRAYGQFVRTFLLPLLAYSRLGWPLAATMFRRDGYEPEEIYHSLGWHQRLMLPALSAVTLPKLLNRFGSRANAASTPTYGDSDVTLHVLQATLSRLRRQMHRAMPRARRSKWTEYAETASHYSDADRAAKLEFVDAVLASEKPRRVLDAGCNTGTFALLAAGAGADVVAIDSDINAVERLARHAAEAGPWAAKRVLPLCVDLAQPTPATGWENRESRSFLERMDGAFDLVMMLAVVHHLLLTDQIPLREIASRCARLTRRALLIEWVPADDPRFRELVRGRDALYAGLTEEAFRTAMAKRFHFHAERRLANGRVLFHLRRKD